MSTVESDSEELAHSSCTTSSTLSSRTSGVSSGAASATYSSTPLHHWRQREALGAKGLPCLRRPLKGQGGSKKGGAGLGLEDTGESKVSFWGRNNLEKRSEGLLHP